MRQRKHFDTLPKRVALFATCMIDMVYPEIGMDAVELLERAGDKLVLPGDAIIADEFVADAQTQTVPVAGGVPAGWRIMDIGPGTVELFGTHLEGAGTIVWNGPMGCFEMAPFAAGTTGVCRAVAASDAASIIGGGDSVSAIKQAGLDKKVSHISTGGGASLEMLEGKALPGVVALEDK